MEDIIISLEPAFHRIERFLLWHNRYASLIAFILGHAMFYAIARAGLRPFCAITIVLIILHILDCIKKKRLVDEEKNLSELTQLVLRSYRHTCQTHEKLNIIKTENRTKYSFIIIIVCLILAYIGVKLHGFYVSYIVMLILFTLPAIVYHKLIPKLLKRVAPVLEQLDQSMEFKRRSLINRNDLLVKIKTPGSNEDDDDEVVQKLKEQQKEKIETKRRSTIVNDRDDDDDDDEENEKKLISIHNQNKTLSSSHLPKHRETSFDMLSDSSSTADDENAHINELYANIGNKIDGKHRIKIKGDEIKIKGYMNKQRSKLVNTIVYQSGNTDVNNGRNSMGEPDLTSFDFLNDYDDKS
ncbi:unnamed protein product [Adineta steineri]|uniref:RETREG1-3/ARL6IP-like N-terminal reticulon-homology domain-containing protein n=1 Tax=Adineta steineri TaxID=433720 RepID=A0A815JXE3_9BILA|nr:unnamed protein product [Adineta steineri]CAF1385770.1 unnamed protein product [Adineta steineri]